MKTRNLGIILDQGADFDVIIGIFGDSGAIDISGYDFLSEIKKDTVPDSETIAEFEFEILNQTTNKGQVRWFLTEAASAEIITSVATPLTQQRETTPFIYDVKMKDTSDKVSRIIQGIVYVSPQATQEAFT